jgi:hypothetical protein
MNIVIAAHTPIGAPLVVGSHHYASQLAKQGHAVTHLPFPVTLFDVLNSNPSNFGRKIAKAFIKNDDLIPDFFKHPNLKQKFPFAALPKKIIRNNSFLLSLYSKFISPINIQGPVDILIIDHPFQLWATKRIKAKKIIYRPTDIYSFEGMHNKALIDYLELEVLKVADAIVATSAVIFDHLSGSLKTLNKLNIPKLTITNGVNVDNFRPPENAVREDIAVYMGAVDDRFDIDMLLHLSMSFPNIKFLLIGPVKPEQMALFDNYPNIECLGAIAYDKLSAILTKCKVGLLLANSHKFNSSRSPMKLYEYGAAGLAVLCRSTPEIESRKEDFVFTYSYKDEATQSLKSCLNDFASLSEVAMRDSQQHSWANKTKELLSFISAI